jgi:hypothetical protein
MCWRKKGGRMGLQEDRRENQDSEIRKIKEYLGTIYEWKQDKSGNTNLEASMPKMIDEIGEKFEQARGEKAKEYATPGTPGKTLKKMKVTWWT